MKKAKEYAREYIENPTDEALGEIVWQISVNEVKELFEQRGVTEARIAARHSPGNATFTIISILDQQNDKWKAFARRVNAALGVHHLKEDGFEALLKKNFPSAWTMWKGQLNPRNRERKNLRGW